VANPPSFTFFAALAAWFGSAGVCKRSSGSSLGERCFQCKFGHQIGEGAKNAVGPVLNGLFRTQGRDLPDYSYSDVNRIQGLTWMRPTLTEYLKNRAAKFRHQDDLPRFA